MKTIITILLCLFAMSSFAQEKVLDRTELELQLSNVEQQIISIQEKITIIESRAQETPEEEWPADLQNVLTDFKSKKLILEKVKFSIEAYLEENQ